VRPARKGFDASSLDSSLFLLNLPIMIFYLFRFSLSDANEPQESAGALLPLFVSRASFAAAYEPAIVTNSLDAPRLVCDGAEIVLAPPARTSPN
jgi:hypothetical protein